MRAGLKPAPTDGSPNNYELCIMHNGFPNGWITPTITNYALCTMDFPMDGSPQQLRIMHYELYCGRICRQKKRAYQDRKIHFDTPSYFNNRFLFCICHRFAIIESIFSNYYVVF